jgi:hypothetical protein
LVFFSYKNNLQLNFWIFTSCFFVDCLFDCSVHGLVRGENMELGRDSDTGGQVNIIGQLLGRSSLCRVKFFMVECD